MDCIFCKIVKGEIPCHKIYEDDNFLAFLDIFPNIEGQSLVMPKKHTHSDIFKNEDDLIIEFSIAVKKVANLLEKKLNVKRVAFVMEGTGVDHLHAKLYPIKKETVSEEKRIYFGEYAGYLTTLMGPKADDEKLKKLAKKIRD